MKCTKKVSLNLARLFAALLALVLLTLSGAVSLEGSGHRMQRSQEAEPVAYLPFISDPATGAVPVIHRFVATPATIETGASATLSWQVTGAINLSISPGVGAVSGASVAVRPTQTTEYTLTAVNVHGSSTARVTVTVSEEPQSPDGFFIVPTPDIDLPTSHPTIGVDAAGGVHVVFTPQSATQSNPQRPAYYAYCPGNCTEATAFSIVPLEDGVDFASLQLDPAGRPRVMLRVPYQSGDIFLFQYWQCDGNCLNPAQWTGDSVGYTYARQVGWVEPFIHSFALDHLGRPRFVYFDSGADYDDPHWGVFYAYCDDACTSAANWYETRLLDDSYAGDFHLAFGPGEEARLAYSTYDSGAMAQQVAYVECHQGCGAGTNWSGMILADTASASVSHFASFSLATDSGGKPRLALYTGTGAGGSLAPNKLYYLACGGVNCAQTSAWTALDLALPQTHGEDGVALALDAQDRPRIAYHAPMAAGFGLYYAWCDTACATSAQGWQAQEIEPSEAVNDELPIPPWPGCQFPECDPPVPACTVSTWDTGVRPSLALDVAGHPHIAYDANHEQGGACGTFTDTKLTRYLEASQP